ncbi:MAG: MBL fold metallo-hydrolase, partial [Mycobacteriaceae bacterium]|nr:MBL fold metallo-hydrolase [Mycobacteriaceae bacterium]
MTEALTHPAYGRLRPVTESASVLLCHNPGLMTLDGTNTWMLRAPGCDEIVVVDPGPDDAEHIGRVA